MAGGATLNTVKSAYDIAKEGGRHSGFYQRNLSKRIPEVEKSIRSLEKQVIIHEKKVANPFDFVPADALSEEVKRLTEGYWPKEIAKFKEEIDVLKGVLNERSKK